MRLEGMIYNQRTDMAELHRNYTQLAQSQSQHAVKIDIFMARVAEMILYQQQKPEKSSSSILKVTTNSPLVGGSKKFATESKDQVITIVTPPIFGSKVYEQCYCRCHPKRTRRSPKAFDQVAGVLSASYSTTQHLTPQCKVQCYPNSSTSAVSATYLFPTWFLSWAVSVGIAVSEQGFDYNLRWIHRVSYSSAIFQCAYQGDVSNMKMLFKAKLGSPFDVATEKQKSLLAVCILPLTFTFTSF